MSEIKDYSGGTDNTHYNGVSSRYGRLVNEQAKQQPKYCEPGMVDTSGAMKGAKRRMQPGPTI